MSVEGGGRLIGISQCPQQGHGLRGRQAEVEPDPADLSDGELLAGDRVALVEDGAQVVGGDGALKTQAEGSGADPDAGVVGPAEVVLLGASGDDLEVVALEVVGAESGDLQHTRLGLFAPLNLTRARRTSRRSGGAEHSQCTRVLGGGKREEAVRVSGRALEGGEILARWREVPASEKA